MRFRQWLADNGYRGVPVYLSEYGVLMPDQFDPPDDFPPSRVNAFMNATFDYLLNERNTELGDPSDDYRLIQKFSWYSILRNREFNFNGYLFDKTEAGQVVRSPMGDNFDNYVSTVPDEIDFTPLDVSVDPSAPAAIGGPVTVNVKVLVANTGNLARGRKAVVRLFNGDPNAGGQQIGEAKEVALAGCGEEKVVTLQWPNATPGRYQAYIQVSPAGSLPETNVTNNALWYDFTVYENGLYLPSVGAAPR
jgi:hypothetical protein